MRAKRKRSSSRPDERASWTVCIALPCGKNSLDFRRKKCAKYGHATPDYTDDTGEYYYFPLETPQDILDALKTYGLIVAHGTNGHTAPIAQGSGNATGTRKAFSAGTKERGALLRSKEHRELVATDRILRAEYPLHVPDNGHLCRDVPQRSEMLRLSEMREKVLCAFQQGAFPEATARELLGTIKTQFVKLLSLPERISASVEPLRFFSGVEPQGKDRMPVAAKQRWDERNAERQQTTDPCDTLFAEPRLGAGKAYVGQQWESDSETQLIETMMATMDCRQEGTVIVDREHYEVTVDQMTNWLIGAKIIS